MRATLALLALASSCLAGAAFAETQATAPAEGALTTGQQIDAYLRTSPALSLPSEQEIEALQEDRERKVHGEVGVAVGSHGYRDLYARSDFPIGKTGTFSLGVRDTRFRSRFGRHDRQGVSLGLALGDAAAPGLRDCRGLVHRDAPEPDRDELRRCEAERIHRLGPAPLGRPMF